MPWFIKLFIGISAWTAAILITSFFFIINLIDEESALVWGLAFCVLAIVLNRIMHSNIFWGQLSLAMSLTGQALAIVGLLEIFHDTLLPIVILISILEAIIIWFHRDAVLRFISTLVIVSFFLALIFDEDALSMLHVLVFLLAAGSLLIHGMESQLRIARVSNLFTPVGSAMTFSFLGILTMPLMEQFDLDWWVTAVIFFVLLVVLLGQIALDLGYTLYDGRVMALALCCALLLIPAVRMPGILAGLLVLALGFWRSNRGLMGLASLFLVFYIWAYYYSLEWTLLAKSLVLLSSGVALLIVRYIIVRVTSRAGGEA